MLTLPNLQFFLLNYRTATSKSDTCGKLTAAMVLGSKYADDTEPQRVTKSERIHKLLQRNLGKRAPDDVSPRELWSDFCKSYTYSTLTHHLADKFSWSKNRTRQLDYMLDKWGQEEGQLWSSKDSPSAKMSDWRGFSLGFQGYILSKQEAWGADKDWEKSKIILDTVIAEIKRLEDTSADIAMSQKRPTRKQLVALLEHEPFCQFTAGTQLLKVIQDDTSGNTKQIHNKAQSLGFSMSVTGVIWQLALMDICIVPRDQRSLHPLPTPQNIDGAIQTASSQWTQRLMNFVEAQLTSQDHICQNLSQSRKFRHIAEFMLSADADAPKPGEIARELRSLLLGKSELTFKQVEKYIGLLQSALQTTESRQKRSPDTNDTPNNLWLDGHMAGAIDYFSRCISASSIKLGNPSILDSYYEAWADWSKLAEAAEIFLLGTLQKTTPQSQKSIIGDLGGAPTHTTQA